MFTGIQHGDRVQHVFKACEPRSGKLGTVTRFPDDPGRDGLSWGVWVEFDDGKACWVEVESLIKIKE